jgi:zinc transport system substrate-binding protein
MVLLAIGFTLAVLTLPGCSSRKEAVEQVTGKGRLHVITSLFPLYDFARSIAGERADVTLLLPPGMEPHSFEPKPDDIVRIGKSGLFVYTGRVMEPWAETIIKGIDRQKLRVVEAGAGVTYQKVPIDDDHDHGGHSHAGGLDPHIWLDFGNAMLITDNILAGFIAADPANAGYYRTNAAALKSQLTELDQRYREGLASCATREFLHGGHYTFGYLAHRYGLSYHSLSGVSAESEPPASRMTAMVRLIRQSGVRYIFAEELLSPRLTEILASEAGIAVLKLHGAHNLGRDEFQSGVTFVQLMEKNLVNLQKGLSCRLK